MDSQQQPVLFGGEGGRRSNLGVFFVTRPPFHRRVPQGVAQHSLCCLSIFVFVTCARHHSLSDAGEIFYVEIHK